MMNVTKIPATVSVLPHENCCANCRQAAALIEEVKTLLDAWEIQEDLYTNDIFTQRLSRVLLHVAANQVRETLGVPQHRYHRISEHPFHARRGA